MLEETEQRLLAIFLAMTEGVVIHGLDGQIVAANPAAENLLGIPREQLIGQQPANLRRLTVDENGAEIPESEHPAMVSLATHQAVRDKIMGIQTPEGIRCWISVSSQPIFSAGANALTGVVATFINITEKRQQEQLLLEQNALLAKTVRIKDQFLAGMSHELRTPLTAVIGFAQLLYDGQLNANREKAHQYLGHIVDSGKHLLKLVDGLLDLAKIEAGKVEIRSERIDFHKVIGEVTAAVRIAADKKRILITTVIGDNLQNVCLDVGYLRQVLFNYVSNAVEFTPDGGRVTIQVHKQGTTLCIEVIDTGVGIEDRNMSRLFKEFEKLSTTDDRIFGGVGLGLALTRGIVEAQGGTVEASSKVGIGSTFRAFIPLIETTDLVAL